MKLIFDELTSIQIAVDNKTMQYLSNDGSVIAGEEIGSDSSTTYLYNKDIQNSTKSLLSADGDGIIAYDYSDFGETTITGNQDVGNEVAYNGGIYDESAGLYYLNARYYDPEDGRFLTEDTYRGETNDPDTWHLYTYCNNNPVNYTDPSGHFPQAIAVGIAALGGSISASLLPVVAIGIGVFLAVVGYTKLKTKVKKEVQKFVIKRLIKSASISRGKAEFLESIAISVVRAKTAVKRGKDEKHHIVARTSKKAIPAQKKIRYTSHKT